MVWFYTWDASGNMIDGSGEKTERFRLMRSATIQPVRRPTTTAWMTGVAGEQGYTVEWSGVGPYGHMVASGSGTALLEVPLGAYVKMRAYKYKEAPGGSGTSTAGDDKKYAKQWNYTVPGLISPLHLTTYSSGPTFNLRAADNMQPVFGSHPPHGILVHTASGGDGGDVFVDAECILGSDWDYGGGCYQTAVSAKPGPTDNDPHCIRAICVPHPGKEVSTWDGYNMSGVSRNVALGSYTKDTGAVSGGPQPIDMQTLVVDVDVDGGGGKAIEAGYVLSLPPSFDSTWGELRCRSTVVPRSLVGLDVCVTVAGAGVGVNACSASG